IPVIDIAPLRDGSDQASVAAALHRASRDVGFLYVTGHGVAAEDLSAWRDAALNFFRRTEAEKSAVCVSGAHRGWLAKGGARMADDAAPDLKESFIWGYEDAGGATPEDHALRGPNRWPEDADLVAAAKTWFAAADGVARDLLRGFAIGLGLDEATFQRQTDQPMSRASFVYYPPQEADGDAERFGVGPHTDFGVLTVLAQDDVGGLQVRDAAGDWVVAPPIPGALVVNVGDLLARWTNDVYRSTPHRVINASGRERLSLVMAYDPGPQTLIDPRAVFGADVETDHEPITCGAYLEQRFARAFAYRARS
ncbi:MAG: 2OG-Fe(II) oxygenase family protein, partial [Pseudomonadota bacterium]